MSVAEWADTYGIHHLRILWSSYRKLTWVGFEPTTTELHSDALTDRAIRPWVQLTLRVNFTQLLQFYRLFTVRFHFGYCFCQSPWLFLSNFSWVNHMSATEWTDTYGIHHLRILWSSYRKLTWAGFEPTTTELHSDALTDWAIRPWVNSYSEPTLCSYSNFIVCSVSGFILAIAFVRRHICFNRSFLEVITWVHI